MRVIRLLVIALLLTGAVVYAVPQYRAEAARIIYYSQCDNPKLYKLGSLDPKFNLDEQTALSNIQSAAGIWGKAYGKPLFAVSSEAALTVNFVYDQRSALDLEIDRLQNQLEEKNTTIQQQIDSFETDAATYEKKLAAFKAEVDRVNSSGGASPQEYDRLVAQKNELDALGDSLNARAARLNLESRNFNSQLENLNLDINEFNQAITQKPEEGVYDGSNNTITIYFTGDRDELIHTLAHEFGHSLYMQHTDDPESLMYPYTTGFMDVTLQDKLQLDIACRREILSPFRFQKFAMWLRTTVDSLRTSFSL